MGVEGNGFMQAMENFEVERLIACAHRPRRAAGAAQCAFEDAVRAPPSASSSALHRQEPAIQEHITDMYLKIENMRNWAYKTAWKIDNGESVQIDSPWRSCTAAAPPSRCATPRCRHGRHRYTKDCRTSRPVARPASTASEPRTDEIMIHIAGRAIQKQHQEQKGLHHA